MLCDRHSVNIAKSQVGFMDFIVRPIFDAISQFMPEVKQHLKQLEINKTHYKAQIKE